LAERIGMMGGRLRARPTSKGGFAVQGRLPTPALDRDRDQDWAGAARRSGLTAPDFRAVEPPSSEQSGVLSASTAAAVLPLAGPTPIVPAPSEPELRDTKVATGEATNDGSAVEGVRAH
jgi:hypothetical protein